MLSVYRKEMRSYLTSPIPYVLIIIFSAFMAWWFFFLNDFFLFRNRPNLDLEEGFENGWARIDFVNYSTGTRPPLDAGAGRVFEGLPVIGLAVQKYVNGTIQVGDETVLSNYAAAVTHKGSRSTYTVSP